MYFCVGDRYKSECVVDAEPRTVFRYIEPRPDGPRSQWDKAVKALELVDTIDDVRLLSCQALLDLQSHLGSKSHLLFLRFLWLFISTLQ